MKKWILIFSFQLIIISTLTSQSIISGTITDRGDKTPLIGAAIIIKDTVNIGTITDVNGTFTLNIPEGKNTLICSYTGYASKEIPLEGDIHLNIELSVSATLLDEVVLVGYGTQVRSDITGSISKVKNEAIEGLPITSVESALQGQTAGVFVSNNSGKLGQNNDMQIRGISSINASVQPLYVIDGIVVNSQDQMSLNRSRINPLADINSNEIESISILKDASAAAIYGSRASNGVIIITTKKGRANKTEISLDMSQGWSTPTRKRKWLNAAQYLTLWDEAFSNVANEEGRLFGSTGEEWKDDFLPGWREGYDTNWEDLMYNPDAGVQQLQMNISGGNEQTHFYLSGGYTNQESVVILSAFDRLSSRLNLTHKASDQFDVGMNMSLSRSVHEEVTTDSDFAAPGALIAQSPVQPLYDPDDPGEIFTNTPYFNSILYVDNVDWNTTNSRTLGNFYANWHPINNLNFHMGFGLDQFDQKWSRFYNSKVARNTNEPNGVKRSSRLQALNYTTDNYLTYNLNKSKQDVVFTLGMSYQELNESLLGASGRNFPNDDFQNLSSAGVVFRGWERESAYSILSWFGRVNYNYDKKYLVTISTRLDGDSRFGKSNRYGFFPAASAGWVVSNENMMSDIKSLSYLKLRGSWGITGNTPLDHFPALGLFEGTRYGNLSGIIQTQIPNPDLRWERTRQINIGVDFGLLEDRISGKVDYYTKHTEDLLLEVNIPATTGFPTQLQNIGTMQNKGIEVMITTYNLTGDFKWKSSFNFSSNKNLVTDIQGQIIGSDNTFILGSVIEGHPVGVFYAPEFAGVDPNNGDALYYLNTTQNGGTLDKATTNNINDANNVVIGDPNPDFIYGFKNTFSWKGLTLNTLFQGVYGNDIFNAAGRFQMDGFGWFDNQDIRMLDRWQKPGDITDIPQVRFLQGSRNSSRFIEDGTYLRLKNLSLSYQLPVSWIKKVGLKHLKVYFTGQNLLTFTDYNGWDPEVNTDASEFLSNGSIVAGVDFFTPPQAKTLLFGIKAGF